MKYSCAAEIGLPVASMLSPNTTVREIAALLTDYKALALRTGARNHFEPASHKAVWGSQSADGVIRLRHGAGAYVSESNSPNSRRWRIKGTLLSRLGKRNKTNTKFGEEMIHVGTS